MGNRYHITRPAALPAIACPCGESRRAFVDESDGVVTTPIVFADLEADQEVAVFGTEEIDGCLAADTIFADL